MDKPSNVLQFQHPRQEFVYMGGTTISCGHPKAFKRHQWSKYTPPMKGRCCSLCGLVRN